MKWSMHDRVSVANMRVSSTKYAAGYGMMGIGELHVWP